MQESKQEIINVVSLVQNSGNCTRCIKSLEESISHFVADIKTFLIKSPKMKHYAKISYLL